MTKLSVLMACYRQEKYVAEAIDSVLNNINYDWADAELILWDDASPDGTWGILEDYARRYPDIIRLHRSEENMGVAATAAAMVNAASGRYIMMFDKWNKTNLIDSRYIWLPVVFEGENLTIPWMETWNIDDLDTRFIGENRK